MNDASYGEPTEEGYYKKYAEAFATMMELAQSSLSVRLNVVYTLIISSEQK